jgi:hypothetical protein
MWSDKYLASLYFWSFSVRSFTVKPVITKGCARIIIKGDWKWQNEGRWNERYKYETYQLRCGNNIKIYLKEDKSDNVDWIHLAQDGL